MYLRKSAHTPLYICLIFLFISSVDRPLKLFMSDLQDAGWSRPLQIPLYDPNGSPPILVADQNRTVHAFSSQSISNESGAVSHAVFYNRWTLEQGWTIPIDIILSPSKDARVTDAFLDQNSVLHVVFFGGDNTYADIYYSEAPAALADDARAWSVPIIIGENAGDPASAAFAEADDGTLDVIYNGRGQGNGLYVVNSKDGGANWSESTPIFLAQSNTPNISLLHVIKGKSDLLHAVWGVYDIGGQGRGIYYARSIDGIEWSEPVALALAQEDLGTQTPTIIEYNNTLFALYNMDAKIIMRRSMDDGKTWDSPSIIFPRHVGVNGTLSLVIDSNNELHLFFGQRITGSPDIHGMWHSILANNRWTEPTAIIKGPAIHDLVGDKSFDPYDARAVVSQGNVILATWRTDPGLKGNGVWFSIKVLDMPGFPVIPLATPVLSILTPTPFSVDANNQDVSNGSEPSISNPLLLADHASPAKRNSSTLIALGLLPVIVLILVLIISKIHNYRGL